MGLRDSTALVELIVNRTMMMLGFAYRKMAALRFVGVRELGRDVRLGEGH